MLSDVRQAGGRTIYFPYLDNKRGGTRSIRDEAAWIVFYSLLADRVLLPPSAAFEGRNALQNASDLATIALLNALVLQGAIVSSSSKPRIRDFRDLFEAYSGQVAVGSPAAAYPLVYARDELSQRKVYAEYLERHLPQRVELTTDDSRDLQKILSIRPRHADFEAMALALPSIKNKPSELRSEAAIAYFLAGAAGGNAVTPPVAGEMPHQHFEFFYSKPALLPFALELEDRFKARLLDFCPTRVQALRRNLRVFSEQYHQLASTHRNVFESLLANKQLGLPTYRLRTPVVALQATVATAISTALSPVFGVMAAGVAIGSKFVWESFAKSTKLADRMVDVARKQVVRVGLLKPHEKDLLEAIESFRKAIRSIAA